MGYEVAFKVLFSKKDELPIITKDEAKDLAKKALNAEHYFYDEENLNNFIKNNGLPPFFYQTRVVKTEDGQEYRDEICDPFPMWIETETGLLWSEIMSDWFGSDIQDLSEALNIESRNFNSNIFEISDKTVDEMLKIIDYILLGKYDRDIERMFFGDSRLFQELGDLSMKFMTRFRKPREKSNKIIVVIKDEDGRYSSDDYEDEDYDYSEEEEDGIGTLEAIRDVLVAYRMIKNSNEQYANVKLIYKISS